jgi:hypothetical protein
MTEPIILHAGSHSAPSDGTPREFCVNEGIAWIAGESWSDQPRCVDPAIRNLLIRLNDRWDDERRQRLVPFMLRAIGTASDGRHKERVAVCREWLVRVALPEWMELAGRDDVAKRLRGLPDALVEENLLRILREVSDEAWETRSRALK